MKTVGIATRLNSPGYKRMFDTLGVALNLSFEERTFGDDRNIEAWLVLGADREFGSSIGLTDRPCYVVLDNDQLVPIGKSSTITFSKHPALTTILSGRQITASDAVDLKALPQWLQSVTALASKQGSPVWAIQEHDRLCHHYVSMPLPELNDGEPLFTYFNGAQFLCLLPLVLFLRALTEDQRWEQPPLHASFMFDDPNLHWPTYGFINFSEILKHANSYKYHVSFATIPLDGWFVHPPTASLFRENTERLSLLFHGNDHVSDELARPHSAQKANEILRQALGRVAELEQRTGLAVARVMTPPHGACSEKSLSEMARLGFEAACISRGSLRHHNNSAQWSLTIGMRPCDIIAGLPVFPRFALSETCHTSILIAALLHQPIIPRAHHQAVAEGHQLLDDLAIFVNSLGDVNWTDMKSISRSLYARMQDGRILSVKMLTKRITVRIPQLTTQIRIERPWLHGAASDQLLWRTLGGDPHWNVHSNQECITVEPGSILEIVSGPGRLTPMETTKLGSRLVFPLARRILTETRDRSLPPIYRITQKLSGR